MSTSLTPGATRPLKYSQLLLLQQAVLFTLEHANLPLDLRSDLAELRDDLADRVSVRSVV